MMERSRRKLFGKARALLTFAFIALLLSSCAAPKKPQEISLVEEKDVPSKVAVLPAKFLAQKKKEIDLQVESGSEEGKFVSDLIRGVVQNQLAGKGYVTQPIHLVDEKLASKDKPWDKRSPKELCQLLGVDGVIYPEIISAVMLKSVAYDEYSLEIRLRLVNDKGKELGTWTETASKKKFALPTSPLSAAAAILGAMIDEPAKKHMRLVAYDWGYKISHVIPECPYAKGLPEVISVDSNIDKGIFAKGEQIEIEVSAEKDLACTFDLGNFKKALSMSYAAGGNYKGIYVIQEGDKASNETLKIHLVKPNGVKRTWIETGGTITIDATPPPRPEKVDIAAGKEGISLSWNLPEASDLKEFVLERSDRPVGDFLELGRTKDLSYLDPEVSQGATYYYRVKSVDTIGNVSQPTKTQNVTMPFFEEVKLPEQAQGTLVPGVYLVEKDSSIPSGAILAIGAGSRLKFSSGAKLTAKGVLKVKGDAQRSVVFEGDGWQGVHVSSGGRAELSHVSLKDCSPCVVADGGSLVAQRISISSQRGEGVVISKGSPFELEDVTVNGFQKGIVLKSGRGKIQTSTITQNDIGLEFSGGVVELVNNNIFENRENEVVSLGKLVLDNNYLGTATVKEAKLKGDILVESLLDAPYPHGRKVVLVDKKDITPEVMEARFQKYKAKGIEDFTKRKFGAAHQSLTKALSVKDDKDMYLYLAYTEMILGEEANLEKTLDKGIKAFPYEVKLYQVYVKHLATKGKKQQALALVDKALRMNPDDASLKVLKEGLLETPAAPVSKEKPKAEKKAVSLEEKPPAKAVMPPKKADEGFEEFKAQGIKAFKKRNFKEASEQLGKAASLKSDKQVYLYLAYAQMSLGKEAELEKTLEKGIEAFPGETRFYQVYAKHLAAKGKTDKALSLVERALKKNPDDSNLKFLKDYLQGMKK
jgi:tetratricopeptide (TPR) repeat protein